MEAYGIRGSVRKLFESYLMNRKQYVSIGAHKSDMQSIRIGVPQGSNLGPIMFLLFINDLAGLRLIGELRLFADDTCIFYKGFDHETILHNMRQDVTMLLEYFKSNVLSMNLKKTKYMLIHSPRRRIPHHDPVVVQGQVLDEVTEYIFLGLVIDSTLSWKPHVEMLKKKVSSLCGILRKVSAFLPSVCLKNIYFALIHSRLSYLVANWGNSSKSNLRELQVIQNRCLKIVFKKPILYPTNLLYSDNCTSVLPLKALHAFQIIQQMHKISTNIPLHHNYSGPISYSYGTLASHQVSKKL